MSEPLTSPQRAEKDSTQLRAPEIDKYIDDFLSTVCDKSRRYILELLATPDYGQDTQLPEKRSGDIARAIGLAPGTTSEHLRQLAANGLVTSRKEGNMVYYSLKNHSLMQAFRDLLLALDHGYTSHITLE